MFVFRKLAADTKMARTRFLAKGSKNGCFPRFSVLQTKELFLTFVARLTQPPLKVSLRKVLKEVTAESIRTN